MRYVLSNWHFSWLALLELQFWSYNMNPELLDKFRVNWSFEMIKFFSQPWDFTPLVRSNLFYFSLSKSKINSQRTSKLVTRVERMSSWSPSFCWSYCCSWFWVDCCCCCFDACCSWTCCCWESSMVKNWWLGFHREWRFEREKVWVCE